MTGRGTVRARIIRAADGALTIGLVAVLVAAGLGHVRLPPRVLDFVGLLLLVQVCLEADAWGQRLARWLAWRDHPGDLWPPDEDS